MGGREAARLSLYVAGERCPCSGLFAQDQPVSYSMLLLLLLLLCTTRKLPHNDQCHSCTRAGTHASLGMCMMGTIFCMYLAVCPCVSVTCRPQKLSSEPCQLLGGTHAALSKVYAAGPLLLGPFTKMKEVGGLS
jgi:hypothetical protein